MSPVRTVSRLLQSNCSCRHCRCHWQVILVPAYEEGASDIPSWQRTVSETHPVYYSHLVTHDSNWAMELIQLLWKWR